MLNENDLHAAMERGIITRQQLEQLEHLAKERQRDLKQTVVEEAPKFVRSFGDLFVALGVIFFAIGLGVSNEALNRPIAGPLICSLLIWGLAEWITGRLRLSGPSIVLAIAFSVFVAFVGYDLADYVKGAVTDGKSSIDRNVLIVAATSFLGSLLFYWRFRLPFGLLIIGGLFCVLVVSAVGFVFPEVGRDLYRWILLACGLALFSLAMWFDIQDPTRSGRSSDAGFWLHLISAPIITHSVMFGTVPWGGVDSFFGSGNAANTITSDMIAMAVLFLFAFAIVAILVDRRALLVASFGYIGSVIAYGIWNLDLPREALFGMTLLILACLILTLGTGWRTLRAYLFRLLPKPFFNKYLPPVDA